MGGIITFTSVPHGTYSCAAASSVACDEPELPLEGEVMMRVIIEYTYAHAN
jgi:hypothetical protein